MDPSHLDVIWTRNEDKHPRKKKTIYKDASEDVKDLSPGRKSVHLNVFCGSDHTGNHVTPRCHASIIFLANLALISWYLQYENTVEYFTFGSEYKVLQIMIEKVFRLR